MGSEAYLMWVVFFSALGLGFFRYGKKQGRQVPLVSGLVLMIYPYFITNTYLLVAIGCALAALPWIIRI